MPITAPLRCAALAALLLSATAGAAGLSVQVQDGAGKALSDVIVYAEADGGQALPRPLRQGEVAQKGLTFLPLVSAVQTGASIAFPNNDRVRHHIYSFSPAKKFDQKLYAGGEVSVQTFEKAGTVVLGCNIHDKMLAYVKVVDTPYYARTEAAGAARLELPAGKYLLKAWHYNSIGGQPAEQALTVKGAEAAAAFRLALKPVAAGNPADTDF